MMLDSETVEALGFQSIDWWSFALYGEQLRRRQQELKREYNATPQGRVQHRKANAAVRERIRERDPEKLKAQQRKWWRDAQERKRAMLREAGLPLPKTRRRKEAKR